MILKRSVDAMRPEYAPSPYPAPSMGGGSLMLAGPRVLVAALTVGILAGCTTAPSWYTTEQCAEPRESFLDSCAGRQVARDFNAFTNTVIPGEGSFADPGNLKKLNPTDPRPAYRLGPLDELFITVWAPKEIWADITDQSQQPTRVATVKEDGTIVLPLLTSIEVSGLTVPEALRKISNAYRAVLGTSFQVDGQIMKYRSRPVLLDGAVSKPGTIYLSDDVRTLGEAIGSGGGLPETAEPKKGILIRGSQRYPIDYQSAQAGANNLSNTELQPGDRIFFPSRETGFFYVLGEVLLPGAYVIPPRGITLIQALATARGPAPLGNMRSIYVVRINEKDPKIYALTLEDIIASRDHPIVPGDRIFVPPTYLANWERTVRSLLPFLSSVIIVKGGFGVSID